MKVLRRLVIARVFGQEHRHRCPSGNADQVSVKSLGETGRYADTAPQLGVDIDVHHKGRVGHGSFLRC